MQYFYTTFRRLSKELNTNICNWKKIGLNTKKNFDVKTKKWALKSPARNQVECFQALKEWGLLCILCSVLHKRALYFAMD